MAGTKVLKRGFLQHFLAETFPGVESPIVQVKGQDGELLPPDSLLLPGETVEAWFAGSHLQGIEAQLQSVRFPSNVGSFIRPSVSRDIRAKSLDLQGFWVTDDQIRFALDLIASSSGKMIQVIDPVVIQRCTSKSPKVTKLSQRLFVEDTGLRCTGRLSLAAFGHG